MPSKLGKARKASRRKSLRPQPVSVQPSCSTDWRMALAHRPASRRDRLSRRFCRRPPTRERPGSFSTAARRRGISAGSFWPSPSSVATQSPLAARTPVATAALWPLRGLCRRTLRSLLPAMADLRRAGVSSSLPSSTNRISTGGVARSEASISARSGRTFSASLYTGTTMESRNPSLSRYSAGLSASPFDRLRVRPIYSILMLSSSKHEGNPSPTFAWAPARKRPGYTLGQPPMTGVLRRLRAGPTLPRHGISRFVHAPAPGRRQLARALDALCQGSPPLRQGGDPDPAVAACHHPALPPDFQPGAGSKPAVARRGHLCPVPGPWPGDDVHGPEFLRQYLVFHRHRQDPGQYRRYPDAAVERRRTHPGACRRRPHPGPHGRAGDDRRSQHLRAAAHPQLVLPAVPRRRRLSHALPHRHPCGALGGEIRPDGGGDQFRHHALVLPLRRFLFDRAPAGSLAVPRPSEPVLLHDRRLPLRLHRPCRRVARRGACRARRGRHPSLARHMAPDTQGLQAPALNLAVRRFGRVNRVGFLSLYRRELLRLVKDRVDSLLGPALANLMFMLVLQVAMGGQQVAAIGLPLADFVAPGLLMFAAGERAFSAGR